ASHDMCSIAPYVVSALSGLYPRFTVVAFVTLFFPDPATPVIYSLSLHDALPIYKNFVSTEPTDVLTSPEYTENLAESISLDELRSEEHTSELQSRFEIVCRLLLEKKQCKWWWREGRI